MAKATINGGHIEATHNTGNYAGVDEATVTQNTVVTGTWVVTLKDVPIKSNFTVGQDLTYNAKGTHNPRFSS